MSVDLGFLVTNAPVLELTSSDNGNGWKLSVTSINHDIPIVQSLYWSDLEMMLNDGNTTSTWETVSTSLGNGTYCEQTFPPQLLGDISVSFSAVDLAGNGYLNCRRLLHYHVRNRLYLQQVGHLQSLRALSTIEQPCSRS